ncbi:MAG: hypothetical protein OXT09_29490, partial [Myxococcales bacterium]|nr:hypothetical protein [Myxococcales bacterium]
ATAEPLQVDDPHAGSIQAELTLVGAAQYYLRSGEPEKALEMLDRHRERYRDGALVQERGAARALALCELGRLEEGVRELRSLERAGASSPLLARVRATCTPRLH